MAHAYQPDHSESRTVFPSVYFGWSNASFDRFTADAMRRSAASLIEAGIRDRQDLNNTSTSHR
jgi:hypothetical protein